MSHFARTTLMQKRAVEKRSKKRNNSLCFDRETSQEVQQSIFVRLVNVPKRTSALR